jgi:hypothetical protein
MQSSTKHFCDALIRYRFQLGRARAHAEIIDADLFPGISIRQLLKTTVDGDAAKLRARLSRFEDEFCHLSIDAATVHGNSVLNMILLRTATNEPSADYFLLNSIRVIESTFEFYSSTMGAAIERLAHDRIHIRSIVGDGYSSQISALWPSSDSSFQNSPEYVKRCPVIDVYCNCHLVNLALADAFDRSSSSPNAIAP